MLDLESKVGLGCMTHIVKNLNMHQTSVRLGISVIVAGLLSTGAFAQQDQPNDDSAQADTQIDSMTTADLIAAGTESLELGNGNRAIEYLIEATTKDDAPAVAYYNLGSAYFSIDVLGSARDAFLRAAAMPTESNDSPVVYPVAADGSRLQPHQLTASATYNTATIDLRSADALAASLESLNPEPAALSMNPAAAFVPFEQAANATLNAYLEAARSFRDAHQLDISESSPSQDDALQNFELARLRALEVRKLLQQKRDDFNEMLEQIIPPQEALERVAELYQQQRELEQRSRDEAANPTGNTEPMQSDQRRVLQQLQELADRVDNTAELAERQIAEQQEQGASAAASEEAIQQQMLAQVVTEFLRTAQEGIDTAGQNAFSGLRQLEANNPDLAAEEQAEAAEALLDIMRSLGDQTQQAQDAAEQMAEQMGEQAEQQQEAAQQEQQEQQEQQGEPQPGENQTQEEQEAQIAEAQEGQESDEQNEQAVEALLAEILEKEQTDRERVNRGKRQPVPRDW